MSTINKLTIACVPEQVNIPISILKEKLLSVEDVNLDITVKLVPEGTGKMLDMLESREADVALTVTDAYMVANSKRRPVQLAGTFVSSPLVWAIAASPFLHESIRTMSDLVEHKRGEPLRVGVSRLGSGSQTMAIYMAMLHGIQCPLTFHIANNITGLTAGIKNGDFDVFLWEIFTTKPLFDSGDLRYVGEVKTPWPAFSIVTRQLQGDEGEALVKALQLQLFPMLCEAAKIFLSDRSAAAERITKDFGHKPADASLWLDRVEYNPSPTMAIRQSNLKQSWEILQRVGLIATDASYERLWQSPDSPAPLTAAVFLTE